MSLRKIVYEGDPCLNKECRAVTDFNERIHQLLDDLWDTLDNVGGVGLAAPQVGVLRQVAVVYQNLDGENPERVEIINPEIIHSEGTQVGAEGCLSVPGMQGTVERPMQVTVRAQNRHGKMFEYMAEGFGARAFCHEIDHLHGVIYTSLATELYEISDEDGD